MSLSRSPQIGDPLIQIEVISKEVFFSGANILFDIFRANKQISNQSNLKLIGIQYLP